VDAMAKPADKWLDSQRLPQIVAVRLSPPHLPLSASTGAGVIIEPREVFRHTVFGESLVLACVRRRSSFRLLRAPVIRGPRL